MKSKHNFTDAEISGMYRESIAGASDLTIARRHKCSISAVYSALARVMPDGRVTPGMYGDALSPDKYRSEADSGKPGVLLPLPFPVFNKRKGRTCDEYI